MLLAGGSSRAMLATARPSCYASDINVACAILIVSDVNVCVFVFLFFSVRLYAYCLIAAFSAK